MQSIPTIEFLGEVEGKHFEYWFCDDDAYGDLYHDSALIIRWNEFDGYQQLRKKGTVKGLK